jgi:PAS domain S-box-containing protein
MIPDFDQLQALRDCCRDEAAFEQLQQILAAVQERPNVDANRDPLQKQCCPTSLFTAATHACPGLLQGVAEATHQLLTNPDFATAINQSLATLGRVTGVDRVYIFEVHFHPETGEPAASQRFEWARESITPQIDNPDFQNQIFATAGLMQWYEALSAGQLISGLTREFGIAERQLLESQQIRSILIVPILIRGKLWGLIGFDDCHLEHRWSKDEEAVLLMMAANLGGLITRQQTEIALRLSESRLQRIAANLPGMIYQFLRRPDGSESVLFASSGCRELFEVEPAETQANFSQLKALIHSDDRQAYEQSIAASATTLQPWTWEGRIVTPSGKLKWLQCASRPERQPNGGILWDGVLMDITDRKQAEQALRAAEAATRASELRFRSIVTSTPGVIYRCACDADWTMEFISNEIEAISGYPATDFIANQVRTFASIIHPEDTVRVEQAVQQGIEARQPYVIEYRVVGADGSIRWVYEKGQGVYDEAGLWLDGAIFDISDRKQAEAALRESEEKFAKVFHSSPNPITLSTLADGRLIEVNESFLRFTEYHREEVIGRTTLELNIWVQPESRAMIIQRVRERGVIRNIECQVRRKSGEVGVALLSAEIINLGGSQCLLVVSNDITDRQRAEAELRTSEARLQSFFNATFEAVFIHEQGKILDVNHAAEALFGYSAAEMIGMSALDLAAEASRDLLVQRIQVPSDQLLEAIGRKKDGTTFIGEVAGKNIVYQGKRVRVVGIRDITERKQAEAALRHSEAKNRALLNAIPDLIFQFSQDGTYLDVKAEKDSDLLLPASQLLGKKINQVMPPEVAQLAMNAIAGALQTGQIQSFEFQLLLDNNLRDYEARVVRSALNEVLAIVRNITDRKQAEAALLESEEKFSKAFHSSPSAIAITKFLEGCLIEINDTFLRISGYQREELIGRTTTELNLWVDLEDRARMIQMVQEKGVIRNQESLFRKKSGELFAGLFSAEIINLAGEPCLLSVVQDITERKQAEEQLRLSAERDRLLAQIALRIRQSLDLEQILNTTVTEVCHFLQADRVFIGYLDTNNLRGKIMAESVAPDWQSMLGVAFPQTYLQEVRANFTQGSIRVINDTTQAELSSVWAEYFHQYQIRASLAVPILLGDPFLSVLVAHQCSGPRHWHPFEIDLLKQLATQVAIAIQQAELYQQVLSFNANLEQQVAERTAQLEQRNQELQELNRLKDIFLHAVSHDLRTPVMGTLLVLKNLLNNPEDTIAISRSVVKRMIQSNERQLSLINSLLEVHASEVQGIVLHQKPLQVGILVQGILTDLEPLLTKNQATLSNLVPLDLPLVSADPTQLRRVFENLLTNALKHNPPGLSLTLSTSVEAEMIRCTVQDDGVGMGQAECDRLFELYFRGASARHLTGIGLGLYLCRQIITAHGGEIGVISSPGAGATFWFTLPIAESLSSGPNLLPVTNGD